MSIRVFSFSELTVCFHCEGFRLEGDQQQLTFYDIYKPLRACLLALHKSDQADPFPGRFNSTFPRSCGRVMPQGCIEGCIPLPHGCDQSYIGKNIFRRCWSYIGVVDAFVVRFLSHARSFCSIFVFPHLWWGNRLFPRLTRGFQAREVVSDLKMFLDACWSGEHTCCCVCVCQTLSLHNAKG